MSNDARITHDYLILLETLARIMETSSRRADVDAANILYAISGASKHGEMDSLNECVNAFIAGALERHRNV